MQESFDDAELDSFVVRMVSSRNPKTIRELVQLVKEETSLSEKRILSSVLRLQDHGAIRLGSKFVTSLSLSEYVRSSQASWFWVVNVLAILSTIVALVVPGSVYPWFILRYALAGFFIFCLPGYVLVKAIFPVEFLGKDGGKSITLIERVAASIGLSLALISLVGILLYFSPWGIDLAASVLPLLFLTLSLSAIALVREHQARTGEKSLDE